MVQENKKAEGFGMPWEGIYGYAQAVKKETPFGFPVSWVTTKRRIGRRNGSTNETNLCKY